MSVDKGRTGGVGGVGGVGGDVLTHLWTGEGREERLEISEEQQKVFDC